MAIPMPGIKIKSPTQNPIIDSDESYYELPFFKNEDYFFNLENEVAFLKGTENIIRKSKYYSRYIAHLKNDFGLCFCQVKGNIVEEEDGEQKNLIEMHHGPLFTLFDVCSIILNDMLINNKKITTFSLAEKVIQEHFDHKVQTVMLSETMHQMVHDGKIFLNLKMGFGDIYGFLDKYMGALDRSHIVIINDYIERSKKYDSNDFGNLEIVITEWSKFNPQFVLDKDDNM